MEVPIDRERESRKEMREIEGFGRQGEGTPRAGKSNPSAYAGLDPRELPPRLAIGGRLGLRHDTMERDGHWTFCY